MFRHTGLRIYCRISGCGALRGVRPALYTVIQTEVGLMSLIDSETGSVEAGFSITDLLATHFAPMEIIAALRESERSGKGVVLDLPILDAIAGLTEIIWPEGGSVFSDAAVIYTIGGWVLMRHARSALEPKFDFDRLRQMTAVAVVEELTEAGFKAVKIHDIDEVIVLPIVRNRNLIQEEMDGHENHLYLGHLGLSNFIFQDTRGISE